MCMNIFVNRARHRTRPNERVCVDNRAFQCPYPSTSFSYSHSSSQTTPSMSDRTPLLPGGPYISTPKGRSRVLTSILVPLLLIGAVIFVSIRGDGVPKDPLGRAKYWMNTYVYHPNHMQDEHTDGTVTDEGLSARVIDGHVDLPIAVREWYGNDINKINLHKQVCLSFTSCSSNGQSC